MFTLLLTLLLGCYGNCYAVELGQIQNFIYNASVEQNYSKNNLDNWFENSSAWNSFKTQITTYLNDNYNLLLINQGYNIYVLHRLTNSTQKVEIRAINQNPLSYNIYAYGFTGFHFRFNDNSYFKNNYNSTTFNNVNRVYSDVDWFQNNQLVFSSPFGLPNNDIIVGDYYDERIWEFNQLGEQVKIYGSNQWSYNMIFARTRYRIWSNYRR